jgi:hypothetical protein
MHLKTLEASLLRHGVAILNDPASPATARRIARRISRDLKGCAEQIAKYAPVALSASSEARPSPEAHDWVRSRLELLDQPVPRVFPRLSASVSFLSLAEFARSSDFRKRVDFALNKLAEKPGFVDGLKKSPSQNAAPAGERIMRSFLGPYRALAVVDVVDCLAATNDFSPDVTDEWILAKVSCVLTAPPAHV